MGTIKKYYRIRFKLTSPLSVGCGKNNVTDSDIILDSRGLPYIPGSSLAGVYRRLFSTKTAERYFGSELTKERIGQSSNEGKNLLTESKVAVYDAYLKSAKKVITKRDMVALDEYKVALPGAKFDMQILEPGVEFLTYLEQTMENKDEQYLSDEIAYAWQQGRIKLGAKTGRGFGQTVGVEVFYACFDLSKKEELERWLAFDMYGDDDWKKEPVPECLSRLQKETPEYTELEHIYKNAGIRSSDVKLVTIKMTLKQAGAISIRQYVTDVGNADYLQMKRTGKDGKDIPVIPGTSWAGAFQAQMAKLNPAFAKKSALSELFFGKVKAKADVECHKSRVTFSESELKGGSWKTYTRNAIDRFTGGTVEGALYTEKTYYNGTAELEITCDFSGIKEEDVRIFKKTLVGAIVDLHNGYMSVGGLTSVGHGLFQVTKVQMDGTEVGFSEKESEKLYQELYVALEPAVTGEGR